MRSDVPNQMPEKKVVVPSSSKSIEQTIPVEQFSRYNVRNRKRTAEHLPCPPAKRSCALVVRKEPTPELIKASKNRLSEGLIVLAKMRTFAAWPARILSFGKSYINVHFFGDDTTGHVSYDQVGLFQENHKLIQFNLKKKIRGYTRAVICAEGALKIPQHLSIFNII